VRESAALQRASRRDGRPSPPSDTINSNNVSKNTDFKTYRLKYQNLRPITFPEKLSRAIFLYHQFLSDISPGILPANASNYRLLLEFRGFSGRKTPGDLIFDIYGPPDHLISGYLFVNLFNHC